MRFRDIVTKLNDADIDFFVTGSFAVYLYTGKRDYHDIDFVVKESDLFRIELLFNARRVVNISHFNQDYASIRVGDVEFCTYDVKKGSEKYFFGLDQNYKTYDKVYFDGVEFRIIDVEELIIFKLFKLRNTNGKQDLKDAKLLIKHCQIDWLKLIVLSHKYKISSRLLLLMNDRDLRQIKVNPQLSFVTA